MKTASENRLGPGAALRLGMSAVGGRIAIPLSLLQERIDAAAKSAKIVLVSVKPGLQVRGDAHALGAAIAFSARIDFDGVDVQGEARLVRITMSEVELTTEDDAPGPLADAIRGGMIDTENPGTLIGNMMSLPEFVVETDANRVVIDLMRIPAIAKDELLCATVAAATSYLGVKAIRVNDDAIELRLGLLPGGPREAALSTARAALTPAIRYLWPSKGPRA